MPPVIFAPHLKRSRIPKKKKKSQFFPFHFWTASALNGGSREDCMEDRVLKMECMSITAILEGRVAFELNGTLFLSFCSFKEEGNETNQKK